jgi:hypothetical protein
MLSQDASSLAEIVDHLVTTPVSSGSSLSSRPVVLDLYRSAREKFNRPLCFDATERILSRANNGSKNVIITTGFIVPPWLAPETDGPVGTATLARSLSLALGLAPVVVTEPSAVEKMARLLEVAGFRIRPIEKLGDAPRSAAVVPFTCDQTKARSDAERLIKETSPSSIIAIEKASPNRAGVFHSGVGVDVSRLSAKVDQLIEAGKLEAIPTIGIGDAGNEIGMGCIEEDVRLLLPTGNDCGCPCHQGVASSVRTDSLIVTGTSNWGASAIESILAFHFKAPELLHNAKFEEYMIEVSGSLGFINPASGFGESGVDAIPAEVHASVINILNFVVNSRMNESLIIRKYKELTKDRAKIEKGIDKEVNRT